MKCRFRAFFGPLLASLMSGCMTEEPDEGSCITAFDCGEGYNCIDYLCVELPDRSADTDTETGVFPDGSEGGGVEEDETIPFEQTDTVTEAKIEDDIPDVDLTEEQDTDEGFSLDESSVTDNDWAGDTTPPTVTATHPSPNETNVGVSTVIEVTFSEPMNEASLTTSTIQVKQGATAVNGTVSYVATTLTAAVTPATPLLYNTIYTVTVTTGVADMAGNHLGSPYVFSFTTAAEEVNECVTMNNPCDDQGDVAATCTDILGSYSCVCSTGFTDNGGVCVDVNECIANPCNDNGDTNAGCTNYPGTYDCSCSSGFVKTSGTCQDVNECASGNGGCAQTCTNTVGSYVCSCTSGYVLNADGKNCDDLDECLAQSNPCDNNGDTGAVCTNQPGSYSCTCSGGFTFAGGSCQDINECVQGTHNCDAHATCTNTVGGFTCACNGYYTGDGIICAFCNTDMRCGINCTACGGGTPYCKDYGNGTTQCVQCRTDGDCTSGLVCNTANQCVQPVPPESCTTGTQSRDRCSNARIIGRSTAKTSGGYVISDDTCYANNRVDQSSGCYDAGADHVYRIYLRAGETAVITLSNSWACPSYDSTYWNSTLAIYNDVGCGSAARVWCDDYFEGTKSYTAPADGWYYIVVDGSTAFDDEGDYTLTVKLQNCVTTGCNCP